MKTNSRNGLRLRDAAAGLRDMLSGTSFHVPLGMVLQVAEGKVLARVDEAFVGEICNLVDRKAGRSIRAQVVSVEGDKATLSPFEPVGGLSTATEVVGTGAGLRIEVGDWLIGRVIDAMGQPIDGAAAFRGGLSRRIDQQHTEPLDRPVVDTVFPTGVKSIDLLNTIGEGQRMAVFGPPGAGKSTLLSMLARNARCDVVVLAMIGERGREVRDFLERQITQEVRERTVVVASTSDRPAMERVIAAHTAMTIAEEFRSRGKKVMLLFDSVTRFARALRDVGLAAGEQTVRQGLPPSFYSELPRLIERAGRTRNGSITAFFTVLVENEGVNDSIADEVMSLTDGHLVLDRSLAASGYYPAIDVLLSKSRLMREVAPADVVALADRIRGLLALYKEIELLVQVGEYKTGSDHDSDIAVSARKPLGALLRQSVEERIPFDHAVWLAGKVLDELEAA